MDAKDAALRKLQKAVFNKAPQATIEQLIHEAKSKGAHDRELDAVIKSKNEIPPPPKKTKRTTTVAQPLHTIEDNPSESPETDETEIHTIESPEFEELTEQEAFIEQLTDNALSELREDEEQDAVLWAEIIALLGDSFKHHNQVSDDTMQQINTIADENNLDGDFISDIITYFETNFPKAQPTRHATSKSLIQTVHTRRPGYAKPKPSEILYERKAQFQAINTNPFLAKSRSSVTCNCALCRKENTTAYNSRECRACRKGPCKQVGSNPYPRHLYDEWWQSVGKY
jgi:hypothetical protein